MKESIKIPSEFLFLYYHFDEIKRFLEGGMLEEFTDLRYLTPHEFRTNYEFYDYLEKRKNSKGPYVLVNLKEKGKHWLKKVTCPYSNYEVYSLEKYKWKGSYLKNESVFNAVSIFFKTIKVINKNNGNDSITDIINESLDIVNYRKMAISAEGFQIFSSAEAIVDAIAKTMGVDVQGDFANKMNTICDKYISTDYEDSCRNNLHLYRSFRNAGSHITITGEQRKAVLYSLFLLIWITYKLYKKQEKNNIQGISDINGIEDKDDKCLLECTVDGTVEYKKPFESLGNTNLDLTHYGAEFISANDGYEVKSKTYQLAPQITSADLAGLLKDNDKEQVQQIISILNEDTKKLSESLQSVKEEILETFEKVNRKTEHVSVMISQLVAEKLSELIDTENKNKEEIGKIIATKTEPIQKDVKELLDKSDSFPTKQDVEEINKTLKKEQDERKRKEEKDKRKQEEERERLELIKKQKEKKRRRRIILTFISLCAIILISLMVWNSHDRPYEERIAGNPDAEYDYASQLEREGQLEQAAQWYRKAINHYEAIVYEKEDSFDLRISPLLTKLYLQNKGGLDNPQKALWFIDRGIDYIERREVIGVYLFWQCLYGDRETIEEKIVWAKNNMPGIFESPNYASLAKAIYELTEPNLPEENYTSASLMLQKCSNSSIWRETDFMCSSLYRSGEQQGSLPNKYSLHKASKMMKRAADGNFIMAQLAWGDMLMGIGRPDEAAQYYHLAYRNGHEGYVPKLRWLAGILGQNNLLDSLNKLSPKGDSFLRNLYSYAENRTPKEKVKILESAMKHFDESKHSVSLKTLENEYIRTYLESDLELDSLAHDSSMKEYLLGIKYAQGYGNFEKNQTMADSLILSASRKGYVDAIYTWGRLLYERGDILGAIKEFKKISNKDLRAVEYLTFIYRGIDEEQSFEYESMLKKSASMYRPNLFETGISSLDDYQKKIEELEKYLCSNEYKEPRNRAVFAGMLSILYLNLGVKEDIVDFYREIACNENLNEKGFYMLAMHSFFLLEQGKVESAKDCYEDFCIRYFKLNGPNGDNEAEREVIVNFLWRNFPELETIIKENIGFDFTAGVKKVEEKLVVPDLSIDLYPAEPIYKY